MVARLKGNTARYASQQTSNFNTVIGNKVQSDVTGLFEEVVLQTSEQVVPLVRFRNSLGNGNSDVNLLYDLQETLQSIVDKFCNEGPTATNRIPYANAKALIDSKRVLPGVVKTAIQP